jgi:beta-glucosidase
VCASTQMLDEILRAQWGFDGYVVSDCDAIADIYKHHHFAKTEEEGVAAGVKAGTDLTCGYEYRALLPAIKQGLISEAEIDTAVKRLFSARFRLGMFDPPDAVPFSKIPFAVNDSATNRELARKAAQESIVLLKNDNNILPLKKDLNTIAVIGPNADSLEVLLGNYHGIPSKWVTPLEGIKQKVSSSTRVLSAPGTSLTGEIIIPVPRDAIFSLDPNAHGMKGEYFNNKELEGQPAVTRTDEQVNFDWFTNSPVPQLNTDNFSVRWTGHIVPPVSGLYQLGMRSDDGVRVYLDDKLFIDDWRDRSARTVTAPVQLEAGRHYKIRIDYYDRYASATAKLVWTPPQIEKTLWDEAIDKAKQADVVVMALGLSPSLEGEEMEVKVKGFSGGDRTDLNLPEAQENLLKAVVATGKPVVLVLLNGSALAINWAKNNVPGIIEAWYPGEEGGSAVADVLFGDYNPAGRLPVTFYKSTDDLPPFRDYSMNGRTYRYYKGEPLYPFGYGLSYTNFTYSNLKVPKRVKVDDKIQISVDVQNAGVRGGDEVAQLYITDVAASAPVPIRALKGIKRFYLAPGEKRHVTFNLTPRDLTLIDSRGKRILEPGEFRVSVGGKQPGFAGAADAKTTNVLTSSFTVVGKVTEIP